MSTVGTPQTERAPSGLPPTEEHPKAPGHRPSWAIWIAVIVALLIGGLVGYLLGWGLGPTETKTVTVTKTATVAPSGQTTAPASPIAGAPVVYGPTALASSQESCTTSDQVVGITCVVTSNDPRVAGTARYFWHAQRWGSGPDHGSMVQWGNARLTNSGGAWVGRFQGIYTSATGDVVTSLLVGTGDYAGLSYFRWEYKTFGFDWTTEGLIFPFTVPSH